MENVQFKKEDLRLYAVTDRRWIKRQTIEEVVEKTKKQIDDQVKKQIREFITPHAPGGIYHAQTQVITGMMIWNMKERNIQT